MDCVLRTTAGRWLESADANGLAVCPFAEEVAWGGELLLTSPRLALLLR